MFLITAIPLSPDSFDKNRIFWIFFNFFPQISDMYHDRVIGAVIIRLFPHSFIEVFRGKNLMSVCDKKKENSVFGISEDQRISVRKYFLFFFMNFQMVISENFFG